MLRMSNLRTTVTVGKESIGIQMSTTTLECHNYRWCLSSQHSQSAEHLFTADLVISGFYSSANRVWDSMYFHGFLLHFVWLFWRWISFLMNFLLEDVQSECWLMQPLWRERAFQFPFTPPFSFSLSSPSSFASCQSNIQLCAWCSREKDVTDAGERAQGSWPRCSTTSSITLSILCPSVLSVSVCVCP